MKLKFLTCIAFLVFHFLVKVFFVFSAYKIKFKKEGSISIAKM